MSLSLLLRLRTMTDNEARDVVRWLPEAAKGLKSGVVPESLLTENGASQAWRQFADLYPELVPSPTLLESLPGEAAWGLLISLAAMPTMEAIVEDAVYRHDHPGRDFGIITVPLVMAAVVFALQLEFKITKGADGKWQFEIHKGATSGDIIKKLLGLLTKPTTP